MKKLLLTGLAAIAIIFTGCDSDNTTVEQLASCTDGMQNGIESGVDCGGPCAACEGSNVVVDEDLSGLISENLTLTKDVIWELNGKVVVGNGVTLTIQPGTIIKGREGTGSLASALIVARGGKIDARGTAAEPIIFTSINDNIQVGQKAGTNLDENDRGLWGGVIILGYAPSSFEGDSEISQIEGIPADDTFGQFGGTNPQDNSGFLQYVSIRHGGALIGSGNEINGLTMGGVGSGTLIDQIEVVGNVDDSFEWFGGTVNSSNLLAWAGGDDALDIDMSYSGTITNALVIQGNIADHALEIDGPEGTYKASFTINGLTLIGNADAPAGEIADFRDGARGTIKNVFVKGFKASQDFELDDAETASNYTSGVLKFEDWEFVLPSGMTSPAAYFNDTTNSTTLKADSANFAKAVQESAKTKGADLSKFNWTYAKQKGAF